MPVRKPFAVFLLLVLGVAQLISPTGASAACEQGPWYNQTPCQFAERIGKKTPENEIFGERYTFAQINWIINSLHAILTPNFDAADLEGLIKKFTTILGAQSGPTMQDLAQLGPVGLILGGISETYNHPPALGSDYIRGSLANLNPVSPVHAQGDSGYQSLSGVQLAWKASRNMAYLVMILLLVAAGFLIMFRVKINPQTAVTLQMMIPKLALVLLLVTFSYAIAGLVFDLIYVVIAFVLSMLQITGVIHPPNVQSAISYFTAPNFGNMFWYFLTPWLIVSLLGGLISLLGWPAIFTGPIAIISLLASIFLIVLLIKIWWMLLKTYVTLILLIVIGPWQIMLGLIPGQDGFGPWFRNVIANASVFAVVPLMFIFNVLFWKPSFVTDFLNWAAQLWGGTFKPLGDVTPGVNLFNLPNLPLLGTGWIIFNFAVGYAILALTPKIAEIIRDALKVPAFKYGAAFGEALGPISKPMGGSISSFGAAISKKAETAPGGKFWYHVSGGTLQGIGGAIGNLRT